MSAINRFAGSICIEGSDRRVPLGAVQGKLSTAIQELLTYGELTAAHQDMGIPPAITLSRFRLANASPQESLQVLQGCSSLKGSLTTLRLNYLYRAAIVDKHPVMQEKLAQVGANQAICVATHDPQQEQKLVHAVALDDHATVQELLNQGVNPNLPLNAIPGPECPNAIDRRARELYPELTRELDFLITTEWMFANPDSGIDPMAVLSDTESPYRILWLAAYQDNVDIVNALLDAGADPDASVGGNPTALQFVCDPWRAGAELEALEETAEIVAIVEALLEAGAYPNRTHGERLYTPLHLATESGYINCVRLLLKHGADPRLRSSEDSGAKTAFDCAQGLDTESKEAVLRLLTHAMEQ